MGKGILLFLGNEQSSINFKDNWYPFRQDSSFLYFFGLDIPGLTAIIDIDEDQDILFGNDPSTEEAVWHGAHPSIGELAGTIGVEIIRSRNDITRFIAGSYGRVLHFLPPFRPENKQRLSEWLKIPVNEISQLASEPFIKAVVSLRSIKSTEEIVEITKAVNTSIGLHKTVMQEARPGMKEHELVGMVYGKAIGVGGNLAYPPILTVNGQILHNHDHSFTMRSGRMLLCDVGAETEMHYAGDITRTFPVGKEFTLLQKEMYQIVLDAHHSAIEALKPGTRFMDIHLLACKKLAEGLKELGLMKGNMEDAVNQGAHALFFQCGLGHMMGLDVHDMEDLGEHFVGYTQDLQKSTQFGLKFLRLGKELERGFVLTVEPGIYIIPQLIDLWQNEKRHTNYINYGKLSIYRDFGGIRVEDNFLITESGFQLLGEPLESSIEGIEGIRGKSVETF